MPTDLGFHQLPAKSVRDILFRLKEVKAQRATIVAHLDSGGSLEGEFIDYLHGVNGSAVLLGGTSEYRLTYLDADRIIGVSILGADVMAEHFTFGVATLPFRPTNDVLSLLSRKATTKLDFARLLATYGEFFSTLIGKPIKVEVALDTLGDLAIEKFQALVGEGVMAIAAIAKTPDGKAALAEKIDAITFSHATGDIAMLEGRTLALKGLTIGRTAIKSAIERLL